MSQLDFVNANDELIESNRILNDVSFTRTLLLTIGLFTGGAGSYLGLYGALAFGIITMAVGFYFHAIEVAKAWKRVQSARTQMSNAILRLYGPTVH